MVKWSVLEKVVSANAQAHTYVNFKPIFVVGDIKRNYLFCIFKHTKTCNFSWNTLTLRVASSSDKIIVTVTTPLFLSILDLAVGSGHHMQCWHTDFSKRSTFSAGLRSDLKLSGKILWKSTAPPKKKTNKTKQKNKQTLSQKTRYYSGLIKPTCGWDVHVCLRLNLSLLNVSLSLISVKQTRKWGAAARYYTWKWGQTWKWSATTRYYTSHTKTMLPTRKSVPRSSRHLDHTKTSWRS